MACLITSGAIATCEFSVGGLKALYLYNKDEVASWTATSGLFTAFVMTTDAVGYQFEFPKETASAGSELVVSNGQRYLRHTVTFNLDGKVKTAAGGSPQTDAEADALVAMFEKLSLGKFIAIAEERSGKRYIYGRLNGLEASALTRNSGAAEGDFSGSVITLTGSEIEMPQVYSSTGDLNLV